MRTPAVTLAALFAIAAAAPADDDADIVVREWLVLAPVDVVARRTLRPDAVFAKHLLDRTSAAPKEGDEITGTLGKPAKWATKDADKDGDVELESGGWAYASVESPADRVVIAKLEGAATLYVNGAGFTGDVYRLGDIGVPVALRTGANDVYVAGARGGFRLTLSSPTGAMVSDRLTMPSLGIRTSWSCRIWNTTSSPVARPDASKPDLPQLAGGTCAFDEPKHALSAHGNTTFISLRLPSGEEKNLAIPDRGADAPVRRTFTSQIDGSVQSYALVPPSPSDIDKSKIGLVLSLHGAGVECMDQAKAYAPKPDFWIVCPTNRGRYGFDWQDWGRLDAYEVLEDALKVTGVDPRRVYLTGHSMGGHGTWHLAANDPGRFLAIAPSAGWSSFESYGAPKVTSPLGWIWRAADGASRTLDLVDNLAQVPTYVLHGEKDDNVPASEARLMIDAVTKAGGKVESHFEPDAGHWWDKDEKTPGADCVDWPEIWELFRKTEPRDEPLERVAVSTMDLSGGTLARWAAIEQPLEYGRPSRVDARWDTERRIAIVATENVRRLALDPPQRRRADRDEERAVDVVVDGQPMQFRGRRPFEFVRDGEGWRRVRGGRDELWVAAEKWSGYMGPFKRAFTNRFLLVYGTAGDDTEDAELLERARYDSEVWAYRANGDANLMSDAQFLAARNLDGRNVIVYGNADTNSAWTAVFDDDCPIQAKRGTMTVGGVKHDGVVAAAFVRPRKGSDRALAAAFADTGATATRLFYQFPVFSSGVGIPDYVVFGPGFLKEMDGDVRAAGWFDWAWRMR